MIGGLTNPRQKGLASFFRIFTLDEDFKKIDQNFEDQQFSIEMNEIKDIDSVKVNQVSGVNGAITSYIISVVPSTKVEPGDLLEIQFPPEVALPVTMDCEIASDSKLFIYEIDCFKKDDSMVQILLKETSKFLIAGTGFQIYVNNVRNPVSLRPTSSYSKIAFFDSFSRRELTKY